MMSGVPEQMPSPQYKSGLEALRQFLALCTFGLSQQKPLGSMFEPGVLAASPPDGPGGCARFSACPNS
ncbi:MAG: hypothetical protein XD60_0741 [Acetothermia bacterium 64_32]|nr:MAG: hypothetical protein XD60_0741 [Acetothermia bacterium 64_32]